MLWAREVLFVPWWWYPSQTDLLRFNAVRGRLMENVRR